MILTAKAPRFWNVKPTQMHWVGINMRFAESRIAEATVTPAFRESLSRAVSVVASPWRAAAVTLAVANGNANEALAQLTPSELYAVARALSSDTASEADPAGREIARYKAQSAEDVSPSVISRVWGSPKPTLSNSYRPELLTVRTFPTLMGYSSRIMAESWESNLLFWADIADSTGVTPAQLNVVVPDWTRKVVERIFASHLEDWPALLKSLRSVGDEVRGITPPAASGKVTE